MDFFLRLSQQPPKKTQITPSVTTNSSQTSINEVFVDCGAVVFVIDAQDEYMEAIPILTCVIAKATSINPLIHFEVFIHKVDVLSDDFKHEIQKDIQRRLFEDISTLIAHQFSINFYFTSIFDNSIFEAFSKVIQKLIPQLPQLESLLDLLCTTSGFEKAFIFDANSKIYIATDSSPLDSFTYSLCSDMIDVVEDLNFIYSTAQEAKGKSMACKVKTSNNFSILMREINEFLSLVCLVKATNGVMKEGFLEFNLSQFKQSVLDIFHE